MRRKSNQKENRILINYNLKIGIVMVEFNLDITEKILDGALKTLNSGGVKEKNIEIMKVPGSFEIPLACQKMAISKKFNALITIGCVIKGETDHYYYVAGETSRGVMDVMLKYNIPIGFGVITTNNLKQAQERSRGYFNKGYEVARAVLNFFNTIKLQNYS